VEIANDLANVSAGRGGVAVRLHVQWPNPGDEERRLDFWHAHLVSDGVITEIQRQDDRRSVVSAISGELVLGRRAQP
jgi:hypothetical protein